MRSYREVIKEVLIKTNIPKEDIFEFEDSPMYDVCKSYFEFYSEALDRNKDFGIDPSLLFFNNYRTINASAGLYNGYYIIQFNIGIIEFLVRIFKNNSALLIGTENDEFIEFEKILDVPINELMYQNTIHFTFYHELGHLVQKSKLLENPLCEFLNSKNEYSELRHSLELDADKFSAICIGTHVFQYLERVFGDDLSSENAEKTLVLICSSALFYILSFSSNKNDMYYKEKSHPHPVIRISCIVFHIVSYVKQSLNQKGFKVELDRKQIINKCVHFSYKISSKKFNNCYIEDYVAILSNEADNISEYVKEFESIQKDDETLAVNKWNKRAISLGNIK
ncbi:hypothetical protein ACFLRQ_03195 [Bacteroidota bacterium]